MLQFGAVRSSSRAVVIKQDYGMVPLEPSKFYPKNSPSQDESTVHCIPSIEIPLNQPEFHRISPGISTVLVPYPIDGSMVPQAERIGDACDCWQLCPGLAKNFGTSPAALLMRDDT